MDEQILAYLKKHGRSPTWHMRIDGLGTATDLRKRLRKMEQAGLVKVSPHSSPNMLIWELLPREGDSGVLSGANRTTGGWIGQP